jgi:hypothetical protein
LAYFYNVNKFMFPRSHYRYQDRQVMEWLLKRRKQLKNFYHIDWYAPTDEMSLRSYTVAIMLVEVGILKGAVVRRSWVLVDRFPMVSDESYPTLPDFQRPGHEPVVPTVCEELDSVCHILCKLRLAVRERIGQRRIYMNAVLPRDAEELEEMMSAVAGNPWRE